VDTSVDFLAAVAVCFQAHARFEQFDLRRELRRFGGSLA
jgi:hypothetical protein